LNPTRDAQALAGAGGLRAARLAAAKDLIAKNLHSPRLSAASVAAQLGVSQRYLHMLFENEPHSFAEFVTEQRLAGAMKALTDPAQRHRRILEIALHAGFGDISTFNRAFRKRFAMTPSDWRVHSKAGG
jgi:AraC-like DNA-binding protein